jgi:hypothetical protein
MKIEARGFVCDSSHSHKSLRATAFVGLTITKSRSIFCTFQAGPSKNSACSTLRMFRSKDRGQTWHELPVRFNSLIGGVPGSYSSGEIVEVAPGRLLLFATWFNRSDPNRPLFDAETKGILHSKQLQAISLDDGNTWSAWTEISTGELGGCSSTGPILRWADGRIAYPFESYKNYDDPRPAKHRACLLISRDHGKTFEPPYIVGHDPAAKTYYWDQRLCIGKEPGEFMALFWTHDLEKQKDLTVHLRKGSIDAGPGTEKIVPTSIVGQIAAPLLLDDGRLLAFVVDRGQPSTMKLWESHDGGATWREALVVYVHDEQSKLTQGKENIVYEEYWGDMRRWSFGHPAIRSLGSGKVLLAHYAGLPNNMSVHWVRVDVQAT